MKTNEGKTIEQLNADWSLDDVKIIWMGQTVALVKPNTCELLTRLAATANLIEKVTRWCQKNSFRCTQIHDNKIWL